MGPRSLGLDLGRPIEAYHSCYYMLSGPVHRDEKSSPPSRTLDIPKALIAPQLNTKSSMRSSLPSKSTASAVVTDVANHIRLLAASQSHITHFCRSESAPLTFKLWQYRKGAPHALCCPPAVVATGAEFSNTTGYSFKGSTQWEVGGELCWRWKTDGSSRTRPPMGKDRLGE